MLHRYLLIPKAILRLLYKVVLEIVYIIRILISVWPKLFLFSFFLKKRWRWRQAVSILFYCDCIILFSSSELTHLKDFTSSEYLLWENFTFAFVVSLVLIQNNYFGTKVQFLEDDYAVSNWQRIWQRLG